MDENTEHTPLTLNPIELRVLGSLIEKEITTPDYHPLTLNAAVAACNQKNNRDPVMDLSATQVQEGLDGLRHRGLVVKELSLEARVPKYRQSWTNVAGLVAEERAVMAELILRGPQTLGELRGRCARMHEFADLNRVELTLAGLAERTPDPLVTVLARQPGTKERRYAHLLGGPVAAETQAPTPIPSSPAATAPASESSEAGELRREIAELREEIADLKRQFQEFRRQFE